MERSGGEVASKRACSAIGKDRISALPDDLLLHILLFLRNAADAAWTSMLSRRWRTVWTLLQDLRVPFFPESHSFRRALTASQLRLRYLDFSGVGATPESLGIWLPAAARRLHSTLVLVNHALEGGNDGDKEEEEKEALNMHCFDKAAKIGLDLGFLRVFVSPSAVFTKLTVLILQRVHYVGPFMLGDVVSSLHCPCLQILRVCDSRGLFELTINSESLLELELRNVETLWELTVDAAVLKELTVVNSFRNAPSDMLVATISAPQLEFLYWRDLHVQESVKLRPMPHLQSGADPGS